MLHVTMALLHDYVMCFQCVALIFKIPNLLKNIEIIMQQSRPKQLEKENILF